MNSAAIFAFSEGYKDGFARAKLLIPRNFFPPKTDACKISTHACLQPIGAVALIEKMVINPLRYIESLPRRIIAPWANLARM
jgi:hypothetical protein